MEDNTFKRMPYTYPLLILGSRRNSNENSSITNVNKTNTLKNATSGSEITNLNKMLSESNETGLSRSVRQADQVIAASGSGGGYYCPEGIPVETALFALLGAFALAFGILFMAITKITGRRRKRRGAHPYEYNVKEAALNYSDIFSDLVWQGM